MHWKAKEKDWRYRDRYEFEFYLEFGIVNIFRVHWLNYIDYLLLHRFFPLPIRNSSFKIQASMIVVIV